MNWLEAESEGEEIGFGEQDIRVAVAALFYHMIAVDGAVNPVERERLRGLLGQRYELSSEQISGLAREGEASDISSAGLFPFAVILNRELNDDERQRVFAQLETLAASDGTIHPLETEMLAHMRVLLKLS